MRPQHLQKHPKMSNQELTKVLSEEYRKLPEQLKLKYSQDFQKEKQEFQEKMALFREQHPELAQSSKKPDVPKGSQGKVPKKFQKNVKKVKCPPENNLPMRWKFHGEPKKPPMNGYHKFHQDLWSSRELKVIPLRERMVEISRCWQWVPQDQKELYKKQAEELQTQYKVDLISGSGLCLLKNMQLTDRRPVLRVRTWVWQGAQTPRLEGWVCSPQNQGICKEGLERTRGFRLQSQNHQTRLENILLPQRDQKKIRKKRKAAPQPSAVRMKMEILSQRTAAPAHRPQGTRLTWIPTEFSSNSEGTENIQQKSMGSSLYAFSLPSFFPSLFIQSGTCWKEDILCCNFWLFHLHHIHFKRKSMQWCLME